jgi:two-component system sensor histidine kinase GlrK
MGLTIFQRLTAGYLAIMLLVLSFGGYVVFKLNRLTRIIHSAAVSDSQAIQVAESLSAKLPVLVALEKKYWISKDRDFFLLFLKRHQEFQDQLASLAAMLSDPESRDLFEKTLNTCRAYRKQVENREARDKTLSIAAYESQRDELVQALSAFLIQIHLSGNRARDEKIRNSESIGARILRITIGFAAVCIIAGLAVSLMTTRRIVRPIVVLRHQTREIASGRFVTIQDMPAPPEIRDLAADFNAMSGKLKELDTLKEDFVSHVSHALRTPLTAMGEASEMLISGDFDNDLESRGKLLRIVRDECKRLIVSVNRILDLSRMEGGMMDYQFAEVDMNALIHAAVFKLSPIAQTKEILLNFEPRPNLPKVVADTEQLSQLLENLIGNALKFTDSKGSVTLKVLDPADAGGKIQVSITDTGCGIDAAHIENIFDKFRRIETGRNTARGTGLGLTIAKHIATAHRGNIWVESKKGQGSTFYFSLPPAYYFSSG